METPTTISAKTPAALQRCKSARTGGVVLAADARLGELGGTAASLRELGGNFHGLRLRAPARRLAAVAPGPRPIEGVDAEAVHLLHLMHPRRMHPIGVVMRRLGDFRQP